MFGGGGQVYTCVEPAGDSDWIEGALLAVVGGLLLRSTATKIVLVG